MSASASSADLAARRGRLGPIPSRRPQAERPGPGPGRSAGAGPMAPGATTLESAAREPNRSVGGRSRRQTEADAGLVVLEPELVEGPVLELLRACEGLARVVVRRLGHDVLGAQDDVGGAPQHLLRTVVLILLGVAHSQRGEDPLARAHRELERGEEAALAERRLGPHLHLDADAEQTAGTVVVALLDALAGAVDDFAGAIELDADA